VWPQWLASSQAAVQVVLPRRRWCSRGGVPRCGACAPLPSSLSSREATTVVGCARLLGAQLPLLLPPFLKQAYLRKGNDAAARDSPRPLFGSQQLIDLDIFHFSPNCDPHERLVERRPRAAGCLIHIVAEKRWSFAGA
jgi:hypothetical protein